MGAPEAVNNESLNCTRIKELPPIKCEILHAMSSTQKGEYKSNNHGNGFIVDSNIRPKVIVIRSSAPSLQRDLNGNDGDTR